MDEALFFNNATRVNTCVWKLVNCTLDTSTPVLIDVSRRLFSIVNDGVAVAEGTQRLQHVAVEHQCPVIESPVPLLAVFHKIKELLVARCCEAQRQSGFDGADSGDGQPQGLTSLALDDDDDSSRCVSEDRHANVCLHAVLLYFVLYAYKEISAQLSTVSSEKQQSNTYVLPSNGKKKQGVAQSESTAAYPVEVLVARATLGLPDVLEQLADVLVKRIGTLVANAKRKEESPTAPCRVSSVERITLDCLGTVLCEVTRWNVTITPFLGSIDHKPSNPSRFGRRGVHRSCGALAQICPWVLQNHISEVKPGLVRALARLIISPYMPEAVLRTATALVEQLWAAFYSLDTNAKTQQVLALLLCHFSLVKGGAQLDSAIAINLEASPSAEGEKIWQYFTRCALHECRQGVALLESSLEDEANSTKQCFAKRRILNSLLLLTHLCRYFGGSEITEGLGAVRLPSGVVCGVFPVNALLSLVTDLVLFVVLRFRSHAASLSEQHVEALSGTLPFATAVNNRNNHGSQKTHYLESKNTFQFEELLLQESSRLFRAVLDRCPQGAIFLHSSFINKILDMLFERCPSSLSSAQHDAKANTLARWALHFRCSAAIHDFVAAIVVKTPSLLERPERLQVVTKILEQELRYVVHPCGTATVFFDQHSPTTVSKDALQPSEKGLHSSAITTTTTTRMHNITSVRHSSSTHLESRDGVKRIDALQLLLQLTALNTLSQMSFLPKMVFHGAKEPDAKSAPSVSFLLLPAVHLTTIIGLLRSAYPSTPELADCVLRGRVDEAALRLLYRLTTHQAELQPTLWDTPVLDGATNVDLRVIFVLRLLTLLEASFSGPSPLYNIALVVLRRVDQCLPSFLFPQEHNLKTAGGDLQIAIRHAIARMLHKLRETLVKSKEQQAALSAIDLQQIKMYISGFLELQQQSSAFPVLKLTENETSKVATYSDNSAENVEMMAGQKEGFSEKVVAHADTKLESLDRTHTTQCVANDDMTESDKALVFGTTSTAGLTGKTIDTLMDEKISQEISEQDQEAPFASPDVVLESDDDEEDAPAPVLWDVQNSLKGHSDNVTLDGTDTERDAHFLGSTLRNHVDETRSSEKADFGNKVLYSTESSTPKLHISPPRTPQETEHVDCTAAEGPAKCIDNSNSSDVTVEQSLSQPVCLTPNGFVTPPRLSVSTEDDADIERSSLTLLQNYDDGDGEPLFQQVENQCEVASCLRYCGFTVDSKNQSHIMSEPNGNLAQNDTNNLSSPRPLRLDANHKQEVPPNTLLADIPSVSLEHQDDDDTFLTSIGL